VNLDSAGSGHAVVPLSGRDGVTLTLVLEGGCLPGGRFTYERPVQILYIDSVPDPDSPETVLLAPSKYLDIPAGTPDGFTWAQVVGRVDVVAGGNVCGTWSFTDPAVRDGAGNAEFVLGRPGQPASCSTTGNAVCLIRRAEGSRGQYMLQARYTLERGHLIVLDSFQPDTPHAAPCEFTAPAYPAPPAAGSGTSAFAAGSVLRLAMLTLGLSLVGLGIAGSTILAARGRSRS
jgi:hypothetical protein